MSFVKFLSFIIFGLAISIRSFSDIHQWAKKNTIQKSGTQITLVCEGKGPSVSFARKEAINNCQVAVWQFLNHETKITTLSIETEYSVGFHQEVEEKSRITNLICMPIRDEIIERNDQFQVWIECQFDLSKAQIKLSPDKNEKTKIRKVFQPEGLIVTRPSSLIGIDHDHRTIYLESVPSCESILVRGKRPRTITCDANPMALILDESDSEIIVRAKGFQPKTIQLQKGESNETLQVFLERN